MKNNLILFILLISSSLFSQNILFEENSSGFGIGGQLSSYNGSTLLGIIPGYTSKGKLYLGLGIGFEDSNFYGTSTGIKPQISYLVLKQDGSENPVSVAISGSYQYNTYSDFDGLTAHIIGIGAGLFHQIKAGKNFDIIPGASVGWGRTTVKQSGLSDSESAIAYGLNATAKIKNFYVSPSLTFSKGNSHFDLIFGLIFPK